MVVGEIEVIKMENTIEQELQEIKRMLIHLHSEVELLKRDSYVDSRRFTELVFALGDVLHIDDKVVDTIINPDHEVYAEADKLYKPIE